MSKAAADKRSSIQTETQATSLPMNRSNTRGRPMQASQSQSKPMHDMTAPRVRRLSAVTGPCTFPVHLPNQQPLLPVPNARRLINTLGPVCQFSHHLAPRETVSFLTPSSTPPLLPSTPYPSHSFWAILSLSLLLSCFSAESTLLYTLLNTTCYHLSLGSLRHLALRITLASNRIASTFDLPSLPSRLQPSLSSAQAHEIDLSAMQHLNQHGHMQFHAKRTLHPGPSSRASQTLSDLASRVIVARAADSSCSNPNAPGCTKPTVVPTLAIVLATVYVLLLDCLVCANALQRADCWSRHRAHIPTSQEPEET